MADEPPAPAPAPTATQTATESGRAASPPPARAGGATPSEEISAEGFHASDLPLLEDGRYEVERELARGGMGRVLSARDRRLGRPVAIKELLDHQSRTAARFVREALVTARLQHPAIVPVYDAGRWPSGAPFYAMRAVSGRPLSELIHERRELDDRLGLLPNVITTADAVAYAHSQGVVHRDLKPSNILVGDFGETVVIDWGLAKHVSQDELPTESSASEAARSQGTPTVAGAVLGTPSYMPPEQARGEPVDARADVYALGAILYHVLVGAPPYAGRGQSVIDAVRAGPPDPVDQRQPGVPRDLVTIVRKAMAREARDRYPSARELSDDLRRFQTGQLVAAHQYGAGALARRWLRRHRTPVVVAGAALLLVIAAGALAIARVVAERDRADRERRDAIDARIAAVSAADEAVARSDALTLAQARAALERDPTEALAWLKTLSPGFAGWPAARVIAADAESRGVAAHVYTGFRHWIAAIAFSPDGRTLATADEKGGIYLWDLASGARRALEGHVEGGIVLAFSPDGKRLASGGRDRRLFLWDVAGASGRRLTGASKLGPVQLVAFHGDDELISVSRDQSIRSWPLAGGEPRVIPIRDLEYTQQAGHAVAISDSRRLIAVASQADVVHLYDVQTGAQRDLAGGSELTTVTLAEDGSLVVAADKSGTIHLWDLPGGAHRTIDDKRETQFLALSSDARLLATAGDDVIRVFDLASGLHRDLAGHDGLIWRVAFLGDNNLISVGGDHTVRSWDPGTGESRVFRGHARWVEALALSSDGHWMATGGGDRSVRVWSIDAGEPRLELVPGGRVGPGSVDPAHNVAISADGRTIALARAQAVQLWRAGQTTLTDVPVAKPQYLALSGDGSRVAWMRSDATLELLELSTGERRQLAHMTLLHGLCFSADGSTVIGPDAMPQLVAFRVSPPTAFELRADDVLKYGFACAPDGRRAAASLLGDALVWEVESGTHRAISLGGADASGVAFSRDGARLAVGDAGGGVQVFEIGGRRLATLSGGSEPMQALAFGDGDMLASRDDDGAVWLWDIGAGAGRRLPWALHGRSALAIAADGTIIAADSGPVVHRLLWRDDLPRGAALREWLARATDLKK